MNRCDAHQILYEGDRECPVCYCVAARQDLIDEKLKGDDVLGRLWVWREGLVTALDIMDRKGRTLHPGGQVGIWSDHWDRLRHEILTVKDDIDEHWVSE